MTNCRLLSDLIKDCGYTKASFAKKLGLSRQGLYKKIQGKSEFKQSEIEKASLFLNLDSKQEKDIFFSSFVD